MTPRRAVSALLAVLAATMLVTGSFGFTGVSAERGVSVNVVESENAYVGVSVCEKSNGHGDEAGNGANPARVTVTNQFSDSFTVERIAAGESANAGAEPDDGTIHPGDSATFDFNAYDHDHVTIEITGGLDATVTAAIEEKSTCNTNGNNGEGDNADEETEDGEADCDDEEDGDNDCDEDDEDGDEEEDGEDDDGDDDDDDDEDDDDD